MRYYDADVDGSDSGSGSGSGDNDTVGSGAADGGGTAKKEGGLIEWEGKVLTAAEVKEQLARAEEKERGADEKFRAAASDRKRAEEQEGLWKGLQQIKDGDVGAAKRMLATGRLNEIGLQEVVTEWVKEQEGGGSEAKSETGGMSADEQREMEQLKQEAAKSRAERQARIREEVFGEVEDFLDQDTVIGDIIREEGVRRRIMKEVQEVLRRRAMDAAERRDSTWKPTSPTELKVVSQEVRAYLKDMGWLGDTGGKVVRTHPSAGRSGAAPLTALHQVEEPMDRPNSKKAGDYSKWLLQRAQQMESEQ